MLLNNIDQEIEVIFIKQKQYDLDSFVRGYHAYMDIWTPKFGDENLFLKSENENTHDKFAVAILLEEQIVGHVPKNLSKIFHQFMKIPVQYRIFWCRESNRVGRKEHTKSFKEY